MTFIPRLFAACGPPNIRRPIVAVYVNAINAVRSSWSLANVSKECFKRREPFIADLYAATTIIFKVISVGIETALLHVLPCSVFRRHSVAAGGTMLKTILMCVTAATTRTIAKAPRENTQTLSAYALALIEAIVISVRKWTSQYGQPINRRTNRDGRQRPATHMSRSLSLSRSANA